MKKNKIACLIPARGGSTRIYNKNIIKINNKSLISYALNSAIKSKLVEKVYVSTNSKKIRNVVRKFSSKKIIITSRSKKSETQHAKTELLLNELGAYAVDKNYVSIIKSIIDINELLWRNVEVYDRSKS